MTSFTTLHAQASRSPSRFHCACWAPSCSLTATKSLPLAMASVGIFWDYGECAVRV